MSALSRFFSLLICCLIASVAQSETADLQRCLSIDNDSRRLNCYDNALGRAVPLPASKPAAESAAPVTQPVTAEVPEATPVPTVELPAPAAAPVITEQPVVQQTPAAAAPEVVAADVTVPVISVQTEAEFGLRKEPDWEAVKDDRITAAVTDVDKTPFGSVVVELDNNHVWQQVDDKRLNLRKGDEVTIRGGMGGSFYLAKSSGSRSLKVKRIK